MSSAVELHDPSQLAPPDAMPITDFVEPLLPDLQVAYYDYWKEQERLIKEDSYGTPTQNPFYGYRKEVRFLSAVTGAVLKSDEHEPWARKTLLTDLDETIGNMRDSTGERFIRPAVHVGAAALHQELGNNFGIGLLTTLPQRYLDTTFTPRLITEGLPIDPSMVFSSRDSKVAMDDYITYLNDMGTRREQYEDTKTILDPAKVRANRLDRPRDWWHPKLSILRRIVDSDEAKFRTITYLDDLPSADVVRADHSQVQGMRVKKSMTFHLPDALNWVKFDDILGIK